MTECVIPHHGQRRGIDLVDRIRRAGPTGEGTNQRTGTAGAAAV